MKLRNKIAAITAAAMLAFTGVGFAAWTFTKEVNQSVENISGVVTAAVEAKDNIVVKAGGHALHGTDAYSLVVYCDAPSGVTGLTAGKGIYWAVTANPSSNDPTDYTKVTSITVDASITLDGNDVYDFNTVNSQLNVSFSSPRTGTYITIADLANADKSKNIATSVTLADDMGDLAIAQQTITLPELSYTNPALFTSVAIVDAMQAEANALDLSFAFEHHVVSVA